MDKVNKVLSVIASCKSAEQLACCIDWITRLNFSDRTEDILLRCVASKNLEFSWELVNHPVINATQYMLWNLAKKDV
jgi:hypothetical protein